MIVVSLCILVAFLFACIDVLAIDSVAYEQQQAQYDGVVFPLNITVSAAYV